MEELLNKLVEMGWKPYGCKAKDMKNWTPEQPCKWLERTNMEDGCTNVRSYRDICSKESGLWQFVCEYVLMDIDDIYTRDFIDEGRDYIAETYSSNTDYEYWVLRSALCDEDKLEEFLLNSIIIDD